MLEDEALESPLRSRYAGWEGHDARTMLAGESTLDTIEQRVRERNLDPQPASGKQEFLESVVNRYV
jgi:xylose isomerase